MAGYKRAEGRAARGGGKAGAQQKGDERREGGQRMEGGGREVGQLQVERRLGGHHRTGGVVEMLEREGGRLIGRKKDGRHIGGRKSKRKGGNDGRVVVERKAGGGWEGGRRMTDTRVAVGGLKAGIGNVSERPVFGRREGWCVTEDLRDFGRAAGG
ncbi:hypothetical protein DPMN_051180 [Dreissena polymorpha]|uniref:Uncharacterized protein n=1 Tax=Dreissena polymorpha TaxID=45954 RepID=A0A9D4CJH8_DREPO|nr:hypothetical protein DPMN_051180 [Dreissena polymorpha]